MCLALQENNGGPVAWPGPVDTMPAMAETELLGLLTPDRRLALSYAPRTSRSLFLGLYALDARLAVIVRAAGEPALAQLKLAWWRERIAASPAQRPRGEPVLAGLELWGNESAALAALVDGWEHQLGDDPQSLDSILAFAQARAGACAALARLTGADPAMAGRAGHAWGLLDIAALQGPSASLRAAADNADWHRPALPRSLRPLLIHFGLAKRSNDRNFAAGDARDLLLAVRLGLLGI